MSFTEENIQMTRISDLPELPVTNHLVQNDHNTNTTYIPMNIHPNPYGISEQMPGGMQPPIPNDMQQPNDMLPKQPEYPVVQEHRLPAHDVPVRNVTEEFLQDPEVRVNYIPKPKITADYMKQYEAAESEKIKMAEKIDEKMDTWIDVLQTPILIGILYFIFQLPVINTLIFKRLSFLEIYREDGNFNLWGLLLKTVLFSICFIFLDSSIETIHKFTV
jgi:hypothetical protein